MSRLYPVVQRQIGESVIGWTSRLAWVNLRTLANFCLDLGLHLHGIAQGREPALRTLARLVEISPADLMADACVMQADGGWTWKGERLNRRRRGMWICVKCLQDDVEQGGDAAAYGRTLWMLPYLRTCVVHGVALQEIASCGMPTMIHDFSTRLDAIRPKLRDLVSRERLPSGMETYLANRMNGRSGDHPWLDSLDWHVAAKTCEMIGIAVEYGRSPNLSKLCDDDWQRAGAAGFEVAKGGEDSIRNVLLSLQRDYVPGARGRGGPQAHYGRLYHWAAYGSKAPGFDPVRECLGKIIKETFPLAPGELLFDDVTQTRVIHSIATAALEVSVHPVRLRKLLAVEALIPPSTEGLTDNQVLFDAVVAQPLLDRLRQYVPVAEAGAYLNAGSPQVKLLAEAGLIRRIPLPAELGTGALAYSRRDLDRFMDSLLAKAVPTTSVSARQGDIPSSASRTKCGSAGIVSAILAGRLERLGRLNGVRGFLSVIVDVDEVRLVVQGARVDGLTKREVVRRLRTNPSVVSALQKNGVLPQVLKHDPVHALRVSVVEESAMLAFERKYVLSSAIARLRGAHPTKLREGLLAQGIHPVFERSKFHVDIYRRDQIPD